MVNWDDQQIKLIVYLIYGTSFIIMFLAMSIWKRRVAHIEFMKDFQYIAFFAILHGLGEYAEIPRLLLWQPSWLFDVIKLFLISSSFACLLSFGLNIITIDTVSKLWIRGLPLGALMMYLWLLFSVGIDFTNKSMGINYESADLSVRYSLGFLGGIMSSYSLIQLSGKMKDIAGDYVGEILFVAGICFGLYAIFGGLIGGYIIGIPVVVFRSVIAILITISVIEIFQLFRIKKSY